MIVDRLSFIDHVTGMAWTHVILLVGIKLNDQNPMQLKFTFIDPAYGKEDTQSFIEFLKLFEAELDKQIDHIQVAYAK
ncbi:MAG: hypothetical protein IPI23_01015 [Bacteroidetes bacterium]|nr:hypothetical protein [Bacteroidota bacterium]